MFVDFNETFKSKPLSKTRVPDIVIQKLCEELPEGTRYIPGENGDLIMKSESGQMTLGGFTAIIPESFKDVLGSKFTQGDLLQLSYNSQTPIEMKLAHEGFITVNGKEIPFDRIHYNAFYKTTLLDNKVIAYPQRFPAPIEIPVGTEDGRYVRTLKMMRVPHLSLNEIIFKSEDQQPFQLCILSSADNTGGTATVNLELKYASSIRDMVESIFIYNDFAEGKAQVGGHPFSCDIPEGSVKKFDTYSASFWEKVLQIEELLGVHFMAPECDTDFQTICDVELLYRNLICGIPIKKNQKLTSVTGKYNFCDKDIEEKAKDGKIYFQYQATYTMDLFGVKLKLPAVCGLFNAAVKEIEKQKNGKVRLELTDISAENPSYTAVLCFKDERSLQGFLEKTGENAAEVLEKAIPVSDYLS